MEEQMPVLLFNEFPEVVFATNTFIGVPIILQYDSTPLIEVVKVEPAGYTTEISIYHPDGTYLAKAKGSRLFVTDDGEKAGLQLRHPPNMTVCEMGGRTLFEICRTAPAALEASAELYAPDGAFLKCPKALLPTLLVKDKPLRVGGITMSHSTFKGCSIGVWIKKDGFIAICSS